MASPARGRGRGRAALPAALAALAVLSILAGCASGPRGSSGGGGAPRIGGFGRDGAEANPPANLDQVPDAEPRVEPIRTTGGTSKPYTVLGRGYVPITDDRPFRETGLASWYGTKFHAQSTASGEPYDMYAMTAAHKTLPLPSYVRVRNPANGREAIVRVNDRGPFHDGRVIDLSYTAALRLDLLRGVAPVEIERITNDDIRAGTWRRDGGTRLAAAPAAPAAADSVAVPAAWTQPVAATPAPPPAPAAPVRLAQARVPPVVDLAPTASDAPTPLPGGASSSPVGPVPPAADPTAPPPRWRDMQVNDLAPMKPLTPPAPPPPAGPVPPEGAEGTGGATAGFWVQLGAFRERGGAEGLQAQAARVPALESRLRVFSDNGTHRLQAGPFSSREAANEAAAQARDRLRLSPMVVERR